MLTPFPDGGYRMAGDPGEPSTGVPRVSIADDELELLADFVKGLRVLEIGTGLGVSTRVMAAVALHVTTVDIDPWVHETIWPTLPVNVSTCASIADLSPGYEAVFIDGDHGRHAVVRDVETAERLAPGGLLIAHDAKHVGRWLGEGWTMYDTTYGIAAKQL